VEKRAYPRYCLWFPVVVSSGGTSVAAVCVDASSGGLSIASSGPVAVGSEITICFRILPDEEDRVAVGRVVRIEPRSENPREVWTHRLAIEFSEPQRELEQLFKRRSEHPISG
jgi:hypothetical protein